MHANFSALSARACCERCFVLKRSQNFVRFLLLVSFAFAIKVCFNPIRKRSSLVGFADIVVPKEKVEGEE